MYLKRVSFSLLVTCSFFLTIQANEELPKRAILANSQEVYTKLPSTTDTFLGMFSDAMYYGRLRSNTFYNNFKNEDSTHSNHLSSGISTSLIIKSATFNNFDFTNAMHLSQAFFYEKNDNVANLKKGKDVLSRLHYLNSNETYMGVLAQAYIRYTGIKDTELVLGRQIVESFYTKSNDTKMIPNTFDGLSLVNNSLNNTEISLAYLYKQKLRDHTSAHSPLAYGDTSSSSAQNPQWTQNDDSAMHKGLTFTALQASTKSTNAPLIIADITNESIQNLELDASFYLVPQLLAQLRLEVNHTFSFDGYTLTPGVRYIKQFDKGAGDVGGAAYNGNTTGYNKPDSLESQMIATRLVARIKNYKINLAMTHILDEADLITPWRGFPTSGYTRSMARYNWRANTKSYRLELVRNGDEEGIYKDAFIQTSVLYTDADETKGQKDEMYYYIGFVQNIPSYIDLQWRLRLGYVSYIHDSTYNDLDSRFELNYLF